VRNNLVEPRLVGNILDESIADLNVQFRIGKIEQSPDGKQGCITIEQHLLDYVAIKRDVMAVGVSWYWRLLAASLATV
jgi:DNA-binding transcriptional regulator/RsmH inhibitor MraZ